MKVSWGLKAFTLLAAGGLLAGCGGGAAAKMAASTTQSSAAPDYGAQYLRIVGPCRADNTAYVHEQKTATAASLKAARERIQTACADADDQLLTASWPAEVLQDIKLAVPSSETFEGAFLAGTATPAEAAAALAADKVVASDLHVAIPRLATYVPPVVVPQAAAPSTPAPYVPPTPRIVGTPLKSTDWALQDYPFDCSGAGYLVLQTSYVDLTGDGVPDAAVLVRCNAGAGTPPVGLFVFDGASSPTAPRRIATLVSTSSDEQADAFSISGTTVSITLSGFSSDSVPNCCPDETLHLSWTWHGGTYTEN